MVYFIKINKILSTQSYAISLQMTENGTMQVAVKDQHYTRAPWSETPLKIKVPEHIRAEIEDKSVPSSTNPDDRILKSDTSITPHLLDFIRQCWQEIIRTQPNIF